jgi:hypothetical protein
VEVKQRKPRWQLTEEEGDERRQTAAAAAAIDRVNIDRIERAEIDTMGIDRMENRKGNSRAAIGGSG